MSSGPSSPERDYHPKAIEAKWQAYWDRHATFKTGECPDKPKYYILDMFPYPSGDGLHVGHVEGYTATDIYARYKRMKGFNVLHPMGWDAFGLPAEQYAVKTGQHPAVTTKHNTDRFKAQIKRLGLSYDWSREIDTTDPGYYKWTQWIFRKLYERGLAYESFEPVNWCPELGTVLANEEVIDGKSEVGGFPVIKRPIRQWVLKITAYAEALLDGLDSLDWPESLKDMQRHWIGRSEGAYVDFKVESEASHSFRVFTTRPDTLFGATFCVLAPEHPLVVKITTAPQRSQVEAYVESTRHKSDLERTGLSKDRDKTGVNTGAIAVNPINGAKLPIFIADYVLVSYGCGAIMAVPGHDERDHAFAKTYGLPIKRVLTGSFAATSSPGSLKAISTEADIQEAAFTGDGTLVNSQFLDGLSKQQAITRVGQWLAEHSCGEVAVTYKLRDWLFSRQRYWGEPFPLVHDASGKVLLLSEADLPVRLPELANFKPAGDGESPLALASDWLQVKDFVGSKPGETYRRETNTMPQWAGSCWYYLRFIDPHNGTAPWDKDKEQYWMPVDLYVGGAEHAVLHLLYARFWHKVLYDCGVVSSSEPFKRLLHPGIVLGENNEKMSKSRGNVVNPDDIIKDWGADALRLYEMFMGPLTASKPWQTNGITGVFRFLKRFYKLILSEDGTLKATLKTEQPSEAFRKGLHKTIKKVGEDSEALQFNTAIAAMMELVNLAYKETGKEVGIGHQSAEIMTLLLAPYAPHLAEELWEKLGHERSLASEPWPNFDQALTAEDEVVISVQVNGKLRDTVTVAVDATKEEIFAKAKASESVKKHLDGKILSKEIYVPGKILNFVVR